MITSIKAPLSIIKYKLISKKKRINPDIREVTHYEKKIIRELKEKGYVVVPNYISKNECNEIISKIDFCIEKYKKNIWSDENFSDQRIFGSEIISKQIEKYHYDKQLHKIGEKYVGYKMKNLMTMANKVSFKNFNKGSGGGWHKDAYYNQFKSILYLNEIFDENGPFELIENSNKILNTLDISFKLSKGYPNTRFTDYEIQKLKSRKIKKITGSAGTLILVDTSLLHRGSPLKSGVRYAITNYYIPIDLIENLENHFLPKFSFT